MGGGGSAQEAVVSGPTVQAAQEAANAQLNAAGLASKAATDSTNNAIQALMGEYTTSMGITNPIVETGNGAAAQLNYMLGLPAAPLEAMPVAPTVTTAEENQYINANTQQLMGGAGGFGYGNIYNYYTGYDAYTGQQPQTEANQATGNPGQVNNGVVANANTDNVTGGGLLGPGQWEAIQQYIQQNPTESAAYNTALTQYQQQMNSYNDAKSIYDKYNAMGTASPTDIANIITNQPGYQFQMNQGVNSIQNAASASGQLGGSNMIEGLDQFGQQLAGTYYQNYLGNLQNLAGLGTNAATGQANQTTQVGTALAGLQTQLGANQANAALAAGQAEASAFTSPAANQQIISQGIGSSGGGMGGIGGVLSGIGSIAGLFSSYTFKDYVAPMDFSYVLKHLDDLPVEIWKYKGTDENRIGPYAEDFKELFGVGDGKTINIIDAFGACFGLIKELKKEIDTLKGIK